MEEIEEIRRDLKEFAKDLREVFRRNREIALDPRYRDRDGWPAELRIEASRACAEIFGELLEYKEQLSEEQREEEAE